MQGTCMMRRERSTLQPLQPAVHVQPSARTYAQSLATDCAQFLGAVQSSSNLNGASDAQLEAAIGSNKPTPA